VSKVSILLARSLSVSFSPVLQDLLNMLLEVSSRRIGLVVVFVVPLCVGLVAVGRGTDILPLGIKAHVTEN
jgi:hypothetical protein